jgi:hypothetical protein
MPKAHIIAKGWSREVAMTALARSGWRDRDVPSDIRRTGTDPRNPPRWVYRASNR